MAACTLVLEHFDFEALRSADKNPSNLAAFLQIPVSRLFNLMWQRYSSQVLRKQPEWFSRVKCEYNGVDGRVHAQGLSDYLGMFRPIWPMWITEHGKADTLALIG